jgi:cell division protein FtsN
MRHSSLRVKRKTTLPDRKFIIAVVIVTSALSFSLGYFVGGAGENVKQPQYQIQASPPKVETAPQVQEHPPLADAQGNTSQIASASGGASQPQIEEEKASSEKPLPVQPAAKKEPAEPKIKEDASHQSDTEYTVQAGAFKNLEEAEALKYKLGTKGYKAYIKKYAKSKNPKLYKVRTGEFTSKEEAVELALKLKKEGLKAFVMLKNDPPKAEANGKKNSSQSRSAKKESIR